MTAMSALTASDVRRRRLPHTLLGDGWMETEESGRPSGDLLVRRGNQFAFCWCASRKQHLEQVSQRPQMTAVEHHLARWVVGIGTSREYRGVEGLLGAIAVLALRLEVELATDERNCLAGIGTVAGQPEV